MYALYIYSYLLAGWSIIGIMFGTGIFKDYVNSKLCVIDQIM